MTLDATIGLTDFKFSCPYCGQHFACASGQRGTEIQCPSCQGSITVPASLRLTIHSDAPWKEVIDPRIIVHPPTIDSTG